MRATSSLRGLEEHSVCIQRRCASGHFGCLKLIMDLTDDVSFSQSK